MEEKIIHAIKRFFKKLRDIHTRLNNLVINPVKKQFKKVFTDEVVKNLYAFDDKVSDLLFASVKRVAYHFNVMNDLLHEKVLNKVFDKVLIIYSLFCEKLVNVSDVLRDLKFRVIDVIKAILFGFYYIYIGAPVDFFSFYARSAYRKLWDLISFLNFLNLPKLPKLPEFPVTSYELPIRGVFFMLPLFVIALFPFVYAHILFNFGQGKHIYKVVDIFALYANF